MNIEDIIYHTTREIHGVEDKLRIATIFIFCYQLDSTAFAELLYIDNHSRFIDDLMQQYDIDLSINLKDKNIRNSFYNTLSKVKEKYDDDGFYQAIFMKDPYALAIVGIVRTVGNKFK